ncbi:S-layer family protein [Mesorhizobium sangaii]|uniref:Inverse autotransporter beta-domain domain-containing protein n=1 Tax=Mesorhizobium sangaii TaxID=505389 RepID=A0A841PHM1_9HYPH|nr:S-layer family protein [Mesorhizobium sangaii]MBB6409702.1 hypothetical protein [Mesorhizobium sangaii]
MGKPEDTRLGGEMAARGEDFRVRAGYRRSQIARHLWKTTALTTLALGLSGMTAYADPNGLWQPQVRAIVGADNNGGNAALEGFIPLKQTAESVLFLDVRAKHDFKDGFGQDVGLGIRRIVNPDLMIGGYAYLNVENFNSNQFTAATLGAEAITPHFDAHVNVYLPIKGDYNDHSVDSTLSMVGNQLLEQISVLDHRQYAAWGIEGEVGAQVPINLSDKHSLRLDIGGYHFEDPHGDDHSVTGAKAGFEYTIGDVFGSNTSLVFAGEVRNDNRDDTQFAGSVRLNIPFNPGHGSDKADNGADSGPEPVYPVSEGLRKRVNERVRGDIGVRIQSQDVNGGTTTRLAINAATGAAFGKFFFADGGNSLGLGTIGDPTTLDDAVTKAGNGFVVALGGSGNLTTGGVTLTNGQTVIGGGSSVTALLFGGGTSSFNLGGSNGTIQGTNPANNVITLGNGNTLNGITITGGADGIFGNSITGATLTNVTVTGAGGNGADFTGTSTGIKGSDFTAENNGLDGLHIEGDGTYNFTGTTLLQGNGDDGLDATGKGTYTFATLNAKDNADRGITVQGTATSGSFTTTGGTVSGNGGTAVFIDPITAHVVLDSITQSGGTSGVVLDQVSGSFTVNGATTISNTTGPAIAISNSPAAIRFGDVAITAPGGDGISFAGVNAAVVAGNIVISGLGVGTGLDFSGSRTNFTAQSLNITGTGAAGSIGIDLSSPTSGGATIAITNGGTIAGVDTGVRFGIAGSLANSANAEFSFGGGSIAGITASLDARGLNQTLGHYAFGSTTFNGPQLFDVQNLIFVGASATGSGNGSSLSDLASIATADANTDADAIFVLVNRGTAIDDVDGFSLSAGQTLASFGNGRTFSLGGIPVNITGDNITHSGVVSDAGGAATLTDSGSGDVVTLANNSSLLDFNIAGGSANGVHGSNISNITISGLNVSGAGLNGVLFDGTNSVTANNLNSSGNTGNGLLIDGNGPPIDSGGTYNFTGTTTLSNNTNHGLFVVGGGTYGFETLDAKDNGGDGVFFNSIGAAKLTITGGTISGNGLTAFQVQSLGLANSTQLDVTLDTLSQSGGQGGIGLSRTTGNFSVSGTTTISNTALDGIAISASTATVDFGGPVTITQPAGNGISLIDNSGAVTFGDVSISQPGLNGIDVSGINGTIGFGTIDITGLPTGQTGLDLSGSRSTFTATSLDIAGAGSSTGIDLSGTIGGSVTIGTGTISAGTGVQMGTHGAAGTTADTTFSFGGGSITGTTASLDMRGLNPGSGAYALGGTVLNGPQLFDAANVIYVGSASTGLGDGSSASNLINAAAADDLTTSASTIFVLVKTAAVQTTDTDADGFTLASGQSIVSFANGGTVTLGGPPANVTGTHIVTGATQADPFGFGGATLNNAANSTIDLANGNLVKNLTVSSSNFAIDGTGSNGATIGGVTISSAAVGLLLDSATGIVTVNNLTIQSASQTGIALVDSSATVNFTGNTKIANATNVALFANNFDGTATLNDLDITGGGIGVAVVTGSSGTLTFGAGSSIANTGSNAFSIANSSANVTYNGTINQTSAASAVKVSFLTGGSATFGGKVTASTGAVNAIDLTGNTGSTINFTGGLDLTTDGGYGFSAINGGTLTVTGSSNTVATGAGPDEKGILIGGTGMTIGAAGVNFASVTVDGSGGIVSSGIVIANTSGGNVTFGAVDISRVNGDAIRLTNVASGIYTFNGTTSIATVVGNGPGFVVQGSGATVNIGNLVTTLVSGADVSLTNNTGTIGIGGTITNSGTGDGVVVSGGSAAITVSAVISSSAGAPGAAVKVDGTTGGSVTFSGSVTLTGTGNLFAIGTTTAPTNSAISFTGSALTATGGGGAVIGGLGAGASFSATTPLSVTNSTGTGLAVSNVAGTATFGAVTASGSATGIGLSGNSGTITFGATIVTNVGLNQTGVSVAGTNSGTLSFASLGIAMTGNGATGITFANAVVNGTITATDFDLTSASSTGTTAVNLTNTTGAGTIQLGDPGAPANTTASTIGGAGNGPGIGFQFSNTTAVNFIYGDGEGAADKLSTVKAVDILNSTGGFPAGGTYNFKDVNGATGGFIGDISEAQGSTIYYVDPNGTGDGTADNPGSIAGAEASGAKIIALIDRSQNGTSNLINMMLAQQTGAGNKTLDLADGQILIGLKAGDSIDTAPYGGVGGTLGGNFKFSNINSSSIIDAPDGVDTVLPTLTTASGNTVDFTGRASIDNVIIDNTGTGIGVHGTNVTEFVLNRATVTGGDGGALSIADGAANSEVALSNLVLSATGGTIASVDGTAGVGTMKVSAFSDVTLLGNKGEVGGFSLRGLTFDANAASAGIDQVNGGAFIAGTTTNRVGGYGLALTGVAGDIKFATTNVAVKTATNALFAGPSAVGIAANGAAGSGASIDLGTATLNVDGTGAGVGLNNAFWAAIDTGNRVGFSGVVTVNTVKAAGLVSVLGGTVFFGQAGNTVTTTGQPAISFAGGTVIEDGSGGSARFGAINSSGGGGNGILVSGIAASPTLLFNGPVTIDGTAVNAIQIENSPGTSVTFAGAVSITNATGGGVKWGGTGTDTLTFSGGLAIQNSFGTGFSADGGNLVLSGTNTVATTNGTGVSISNAGVSGGFTSVNASFAAGNGINLQNLTGSLNLGTGTLTNTGAGAAFNVGSATNASGGNAAISYAGTIASNGSGAAVSIRELTGGSVTLSGNLTDGNSAVGGNIVVAGINNGTAATVTFSGASKQIRSGATDAVSLGILGSFVSGTPAPNPDATINFTNGGLNITTTTGAGFVALNSGIISITGANNTIAGGDGLLVAATNVGAGGIAFDSISSVATAPGGGVVLNNVDLAGNVNIGGLTNTGAIGVSMFGVTTSSGKSVNFTGTTNIDVDTSGFQFGGQVATVNIANVAGSSLTIDGGTRGIDFNGVMGGTVNIGGNGGSASIGATTSTSDFAIAVGGNTGGTLNYNGSVKVNAGSVVSAGGGDLAILNLSGSVLSTTASTAFVFSGNADGAYTISSTINHTGGTGVLVDGSSEGTITFSGATKTFSTGANDAVVKQPSIGPGQGTATLAFTGGGLGITTTSGAGFTASTFGAGTVSVTGAGNTISTQTGTALKLDSATVGAGSLNFSSVSANGAATGVSLNNVGGGGIILGTVNLQGITSRGFDVAGTLGSALSITSLNIGLGGTNAIGLDLNGAVISTGINAGDFDVNGGGFAGTLGIDMAGTTSAAAIQLGDTVNPGGAQTSTITNVAQGIQFSSTTNATLVFGDGAGPAESLISTTGGQVIHATDTLPLSGNYDFDDVTFVGDISNLSAISVYYIDAAGEISGIGDGSFLNPGSVAQAEASTANVFVLIDKTVDTNQPTINIGNSSLDLKDGQAVISFMSGDADIDVGPLGVGGGLGAPSSFHFTTIQASTVVTNPGGLDNSHPILASSGAAATINLPISGTGVITAGVQNVTALNSGSGAGIFVNATLASNFVIRNSIITAGGNALDFSTSGAATADKLLLSIDGNTLRSTASGLAASFVGQNINATDNSIAIRSFAGNRVTGGAGSGGIVFNNVRFDSNGAGGTVSAGTLGMGTPGTRIQGNGLSFINTSGTFDLGTLSLANTGGTGVIANTKTTTFTLNSSAGVVTTNSGAAFDLDPLTVNMTLTSVNANSSTSGIIFDGVAGTFTVTGATSISNTTGFGIDAINTNTGTFNFNTVTINNTATTGGGIHVATGTLNVTGLANIDTTSGIGLSQGGGTTSFTGGLTIDTTSGTGILGTGGTIGITASAAAETVNATSGQAINLSGVVAAIALDSTSSAGGVNNVSLTSVGGTVGLGSGTLSGASGASFNVVGGTAAVTYGGNITQANNAALVSVSAGHTGTLTFNTGTLSATNGTGLQFANADGTYNFNGTTTLNGGDAGVDITTGSSGTFSFGTGTSITSPTGTAFNVDTSSASVTYNGNITQANNAALVAVTGHTTGTITFQTGTLSATNGTGLQFNNADGTYLFNGTTTLNGGDAGVDILNGSGGTFSFSSGTSITNPSGVGFLVAGGTSTVTFNGTISKTAAAGKIVDISGVTAGTITLAGNLTATGGFDNGIFVHGNTGGTFNFSGGTKTLTTGVNTAVDLATNAGATINFTNGGLAINTTSGTGFNATGGGTVSVTGAGNSITTTSGIAVNLDTVIVAAAGVNFATTTKGAGGGSAVIMDTVTGTGTVSLGGGSLVGGNAAVIRIGDGAGGANTGGTAGLTYAGTITSGTGRGIDIQDRALTAQNITLTGNISHSVAGQTGIFLDGNAAGTITFSGASKSIGSGTAAGVSLTNDTGAIIDFTGGGLAINSTSGIGFNATGGGTVTVQGTGNTIASTTGTALNVANTTIGASGLTFRSISANGAVNGIVLNNTGANGLTVTGDGATSGGFLVLNGAGGTIQNTTGDSVVLTNASNVNLRQMNITNAGLDGVQSIGGGNIKLSAVNITNPGASNPASDGSSGNPAGFGGGNGWFAQNITGVNAFDNNSKVSGWQSSQSNGVLLFNTNTNFTSFTVDHALFTTSATGADGFLANLFGSTSGTVNVTSSEFTLIDQDGVQISNQGSGTVNAIVQKNNFHDADNTSGDGNNTLYLSNSANGILNFTIGGPTAADGNTFHNLARLTTLAGVVQVDAAGGSAATPDGGQINGSIRNNTISNDAGFVNGRRAIDVQVEADSHDLGKLAVAISDNTINNVSKQGVHISVVSVGGGSVNDANWTIQNNHIGDTSPVGTEGNVDSGSAIEFETNFDTFTSGADMVNNLLIQGNIAVNNANNATGATLDITNIGGTVASGTTAVLNATILNNVFTNNSTTGGHVLDVLNSSAGDGETLNLNISGNNTTLGASTLGEIRLRQLNGTFNIQGGIGAVSGNNSGDTVSQTGSFGTVGSVTLPSLPTGGF